VAGGALDVGPRRGAESPAGDDRPDALIEIGLDDGTSAAVDGVDLGLLHGFGLCVNKAWVGVRPYLPVAVNGQSGWWRTLATILTQLWIMAAWVFFRCDSVYEANNVLALSFLHF